MLERVEFEAQTVMSQYLSSQQVSDYFDLLMDQNQRVNLVSRETGRGDFDRLVGESLLPLGQLPPSMNGYLDIGSGGGFPSVPLLMTGRIVGKSTLIERTGKKARALKEIVGQLGLKAQVESRTFEEIRAVDPVELITLRYVRLTATLLRQIMNRLAEGGHFVYYSTADFNTSDFSTRRFEFESPQGSTLKSFTIFSR